MVTRKPARGSHEPGDYFYYNNWDFNVLGVIFERLSKLSLGEAFTQWVAAPTGMTGFTAGDVVYTAEGDSDFPMYRFYIGAEDLARFGALYANADNWGQRQVVPVSWVEESLRPHSEVTYSDDYQAYGYLWSLNIDNGYAYADGSGGQTVLVDRTRHRTIVVLNDTGQSPLGTLFWYSWFGSDVAPTANDVATILDSARP